MTLYKVYPIDKPPAGSFRVPRRKKMSDATQEITPKLETPAWVTETPEETYTLVLLDHDGNNAQDVTLTRAEYIALKRHLAGLRGLPVPLADDEAAPAEAAGATEGPISGRLVGSMFDRIISDLEGHRDFVATYRGRAKWDASDWSEFQADLALLHEIVEDWTNDGHTEEYPNETKLIGTIRAYLEQ
jgi:hypothetical protein